MTMRYPGCPDEYWGERDTYQITLAHSLCFTASMARSLLIRRDVFLQLGGFDTRLSHMEDFEFGIRLLASGCETHFLGEPLFIYDRGGRQQASAQLVKMYEGEMAALKLHAPLVRKAFGPTGLIRLKACCRKKHGLKIGHSTGRLLWAVGCAQQAIVGLPLI